MRGVATPYTRYRIPWTLLSGVLYLLISAVQNRPFSKLIEFSRVASASLRERAVGKEAISSRVQSAVVPGPIGPIGLLDFLDQF